jgi:hypothetical protein
MHRRKICTTTLFDLKTRVVGEAIDKNYTLALLYPSEEVIDLDQPTKDEHLIRRQQTNNEVNTAYCI